MKITFDIEGGGSLILKGPEAEELFEVLKGHADEKDLLTPGCSISIEPGQRVVDTPTERRVSL